MRYLRSVYLVLWATIMGGDHALPPLARALGMPVHHLSREFNGVLMMLGSMTLVAGVTLFILTISHGSKFWPWIIDICLFLPIFTNKPLALS